ncbi:MAG TPA: very short patch repair endonuclease [Ktedonobacteraceae bacterium]|nr:very short patch repair endonuclease [Ktedonobacteraceae bacterium]
MDTVDKETRSRVMSTIRNKHTKLEQIFEQLLQEAGVTEFACYVRELPGTPDIVFMEVKVAVFVDSCFWHGCPKHLRRPKSNETYWQPKIEKNIKRDQKTRAALRRRGWSVLRIWEHDLKYPAKAVEKVRRAIARRKEAKEGTDEKAETNDHLT